MSNIRFTETFKAFTDGLGIMGSNSERKAFVAETFSRLHRTTQQQFMNVVIIPVLEKLSEDYKAGWCDGRNMAAGRLATKMLEDLTDDDLYLPLI